MCSMYPLSNSREIHIQSAQSILAAIQEEYIYNVFNISSMQLKRNTYTKCSMYPLSTSKGIHIQCGQCILSATQEKYI